MWMPIQMGQVCHPHLNWRRYLTGSRSHEFRGELFAFVSEILVRSVGFSPRDEAAISENAFEGILPFQDDIRGLVGTRDVGALGEMVTSGCPIPCGFLVKCDVVAGDE